MTVALCPGSFDPPTNGHIDVLKRAAAHFEGIVVAVLHNPSKATMFDSDERVELLRGILEEVPNAEVVAHEGLLVSLARERGASVIVKGLRALSDVEYELQMAQMNASLAGNLDTVFVASDPKWSYISSSLVKEVGRLGGDIGRFVPATVAEALGKKFSGAG